MATTTDHRPPAELEVQVDFERDGVLVDQIPDDFPQYRTDALPTPSMWREFIDRITPPALRHGTYDLAIYLAPLRETDPGRDLLVSFREDLVLHHVGRVTFADDGSVTWIWVEANPMRFGAQGDLHIVSREALMRWSADLEDMLNAYDDGEDGSTLKTKFLAAHSGV